VTASWRRGRGQALVELAIVLPIILVLACGAVAVVQLARTQMALETAASATALVGARGVDAFEACVDAHRELATVLSESSGLISPNLTDELRGACVGPLPRGGSHASVAGRRRVCALVWLWRSERQLLSYRNQPRLECPNGRRHGGITGLPARPRVDTNYRVMALTPGSLPLLWTRSIPSVAATQLLTPPETVAERQRIDTMPTTTQRGQILPIFCLLLALLLLPVGGLAVDGGVLLSTHASLVGATEATAEAAAQGRKRDRH
jgi:uncharacterized protein (UPF0333 family)